MHFVGRLRRSKESTQNFGLPPIALTVALSGCGVPAEPQVDAPDSAQAEQALGVPPLDIGGTRSIPLRFAHLVDDNCLATGPRCGNSCSGASNVASMADVLDSVARANEVYAPLGIEFYVRKNLRVDAPYEWCKNGRAPAEGDGSWAQAKQKIMGTYSWVPASAWADADTRGDWWTTASALYGRDDEILVVVKGDVNSGSASGSDFPWSGRVMSLQAAVVGNYPLRGNGTINFLPHELGHYFGLRHVFEETTQTNPKTGGNWSILDQWDLAYRPAGNPDDPFGPNPAFFPNRDDAESSATELELVVQRPEHPCGNLDFDGNYVNSSPETDGRIRCELPFDNGSVRDFETGDPGMDGVSFDLGIVPNPPDVLQFGRNVMDRGNQTSPNRISPSQMIQVATYLAYDAELSQSAQTKVGPLPPGFNSFDLQPSRHRLGAFDDSWQDSGMNFCEANEDTLHIGDFNGDSRDDLLCNRFDGDIDVRFTNSTSRPTGSSLDTTYAAANFCNQPSDSLHIGTFNQDNRSDLLCLQGDGAAVIVYASSTGALDSTWYYPLHYCTAPGEASYVGDFNSDGRTDVLCNRTDGTMSVRFANSLGQLAGTSLDWTATLWFCASQGEVLRVGDFNGDGRSDLLCNRSTGVMSARFTNSAGQSGSSLDWSLQRDFCTGALDVLSVVEINADQHDDILCRDLVTGHLELDFADAASRFSSTNWSSPYARWCAASPVYVGNFDGDQRQDLLCNQLDGTMGIEYSAMPM